MGNPCRVSNQVPKDWKGEFRAMAKKIQDVKTTSFLAAGTELEGKLRVKGGIRIDGKLKGSIQSDAVVYLGDTARIQANIQAEGVVSSGKVDGDLYSSSHVHLSTPGSVKGTIETRELVLDKGVFFSGTCKIIESDA